MNLNITGHHLEITPAIRDYVASKLDRQMLKHKEKKSEHAHEALKRQVVD